MQPVDRMKRPDGIPVYIAPFKYTQNAVEGGAMGGGRGGGG